MSDSQNSLYSLNNTDADNSLDRENARENTTIDIRAAIKSARSAHNISQKELAARTGIKQSNISRIEKGTFNPNIATLIAIAKGLGKELHIEFRNPS